MTRAPVFRVADVAEAEALVSWTRDNFAALKEAAEDDEPRRTPRRDAVRRRQLGVPAIPLRHQGRDGDEHGHHRHRGRLRRRRSRDSRLARRPLGQPLFRQRSPPPSTPSRGAAGASPPTFDPARGRRRTPAHHARSGRGTQHTQEPGRLREAASLGFNAHVANVVAAMFLATGRDGAQVVEGANAITTAEVQDGDLYVSVSIASLEVGTVGGGTKLPTQSRGLDILGVSGGGDPPAPTPTPSPDASPSVPSRANSPFSPRSPRGTSPAPTPNSVGNCMGVVVRPRFIGSEFVDPTLIMNVLSREIPRDYEIPRYNAYHEHITKG